MCARGSDQALLGGPSTSPLGGGTETHRRTYVMRAAVLLSVLILICGVAALLGIPAVWVDRQPITGIAGFLTALLGAAIPPVVVLGWRKLTRK